MPIFARISDITARFDGRYKLNIGDKLKLAMDKHRIHLFDKETQVAIREEKVKVSSSEIREKIKLGKDCRNLLPKSVFDYIIKNSLYK